MGGVGYGVGINMSRFVEATFIKSWLGLKTRFDRVVTEEEMADVPQIFTLKLLENEMDNSLHSLWVNSLKNLNCLFFLLHDMMCTIRVRWGTVVKLFQLIAVSEGKTPAGVDN